MFKNNEDLVFARSLFQVMVQQENLDECLEQFRFFSHVLYENPYGVYDFLCSHKVGFDQKRRFMYAVFGHVLLKELLIFIALVIKKVGAKSFKGIFLCYERIVDEYFQRSRGTVYSVYALDGDVLEDLRNVLKKRFNKDFILHCVLDEAILGGLVVCFEDRRVDLSVRTRLDGLYRNILSSQFTGVL